MQTGSNATVGRQAGVQRRPHPKTKGHMPKTKASSEQEEHPSPLFANTQLISTEYSWDRTRRVRAWREMLFDEQHKEKTYR